MALPLKSHLNARIAAAFVGFFGGFAVFVFFVFGSPSRNFGLTPLLFFGPLFRGAHLAQLPFSPPLPPPRPPFAPPSAPPPLRNPLPYSCPSLRPPTASL